MRIRASVVPFAMLGLLTACGGSSSKTNAGAGSATTTAPAATTAAPTGTASAGGSSGGTVLNGTVGKGDAFTIDLVDGTGAKVTTLKAGTYQVKVKDMSKIHNFHLVGPGVEKTTSVPDVTDVTWSVTLKAGSYTYQCDPHAKHMVGSFTVS